MKTRVLFLCTGNSARSQMAEALLRHYAGDKFEVHSAGLEPKGIHPMTVQVMQEIGLELDGHSAKSVGDFLGKVHFGYVVTVCANAEERCPIFPGVSQRLHWPFDDPAAFEGSEEARLDKFRQVRDQIDDQIRAWLEIQPVVVPPRQPATGEGATKDEDTTRLLDDLEDKVLALGDQVEGMLTQSVSLLQRPDPKGLVWLREEGRHARQQRLAIETRGLALNAALEPQDGDGRSPVVLIEIASNLELIGEHAQQIGRADYVVLDRCFDSSLQSIRHLVETVRRMLHQAVWAAAQRDQVAAQAVLARAAETASLYETVQQELQTLMRRQHRFVSQAVHLAHSVNQLGLATEKVVSICEWVLFEIGGGTDGTANV